MSIIIYMSVHTEFIIPNQVVVLRIMPSVFLVLLRLLEEVIVAMVCYYFGMLFSSP